MGQAEETSAGTAGSALGKPEALQPPRGTARGGQLDAPRSACLNPAESRTGDLLGPKTGDCSPMDRELVWFGAE